MSMAKWSWLWVSGGLWLMACAGSRACAQDSAQAAEDKNPVIEKLVEKIELLSREVLALRRRLDPEFYSDTDPQQRLAAY